MQRFMKKIKESSLWIIMSLLLFSACKSDDEVENLSDEGTNDWIYRVMDAYYLWYEDIPEKNNLNFSQSPDKFFESLLSSQDGVTFDGKWVLFSSIKQKEETTKGISESDSYGFEYATFKDNKNYYAWVLYVLPGSPAADAGLKRGDWIIAIDSDTPNVTNVEAFSQGGATSFQLADATVENKTVVFRRRELVEIASSRAVENTPFLKDSVYTIGGKRIGYLLYNGFTSGPNDENDQYDEQMKDLFIRFKAQQVREFVLDLRYNQGGLVSSAQLLTSFLAPAEALGKTFCYIEYNKKQEEKNREELLYKNSQLDNANLDLDRLYVLTGSTTASASEAVINCLIPYMGRSNIILIGEKTVGKRVGSNVFGSKEKYGWLLHPIVLRIYNANHQADYANGFMPDMEVKELIVGKTLYPFGDTNELLFKEAIQQITGKQKKKRTSYTMVEDDYLYLKPFLNMKKVKGLIDDYDNLE
ncbi:MAG: hypothetical protein IKU29_10845 [Parabacteroides sp.]|nr:hypothetical protein [Parabacteroides sp.]